MNAKRLLSLLEIKHLDGNGENASKENGEHEDHAGGHPQEVMSDAQVIFDVLFHRATIVLKHVLHIAILGGHQPV